MEIYDATFLVMIHGSMYFEKAPNVEIPWDITIYKHAEIFGILN